MMHGAPIHIAIVDDDRSIRRAMTRMIAAHSMVAKSYASAREFLASLETEIPGCLILDVHMPEMTGLELLHHLAGTGQNIPAIILTASDEPDLRHRCELAGARTFLCKPVSGDTLLVAIQTIMERDGVNIAGRTSMR